MVRPVTRGSDLGALSPVTSKSPAPQLRGGAESIVLEDNEEEPFKVVREFSDYAFMSIVGWHLFELIGSRASAGEDRDTDSLDPYSLVMGDNESSVSTTRSAMAAVAAEAAGDPQRELGQYLFNAMMYFVLALRESARGSSNHLRIIGIYDNIRVGLATMTSRHNNSGILADYMSQVSNFVAPETVAALKMQYCQGGLTFVVGHFDIQEKVSASRKHAARGIPPRRVMANGSGYPNGGGQNRDGVHGDGVHGDGASAGTKRCFEDVDLVATITGLGDRFEKIDDKSDKLSK
ncbi:hypothetical protein SARC_11551 [Sphaeroforma arctica JP610]|uniref:Uncharacterized protein n=1 Tax=Sphaeroforma arctica JP610 TaxID=667725 RepID=A0A0L0FIS0_9EUKA|nr:hypothetical protein SARC_11551 [Sphaeroforma arctica JP610]KNC75933.1 hypothetical protein SARC_11551 [Sphaeroforma arctica JP610]|eukprot:XP_014149835.1 hypothetical protein SARC_11551 [Sphaeroforma arctica JP610]